MLTTINGLSGWGKTTLTRRLIRGESRAVLILAPYPEDYDTVSIHADSITHALKILESFPLAKIHIKSISANEPAQADFLCYRIMQSKKSCLVCIDECQRIRTGKDIPFHVKQIIDEGRHINVDLIAIARRPVQTPIIFRSLVEQNYSFRLNSQNDIRIQTDYYGDSAEKLRELERFKFYSYNSRTGIFEIGETTHIE